MSRLCRYFIFYAYLWALYWVIVPFCHLSDKNKNKYINAFQMELRTTYIRTTDGG